MKHILGVSAGYHDAAAAVINYHGEIVFAGHSERHSKIKSDPNINRGLVEEVFGLEIDTIAYYERPWMKQLRRLRTGEGVEWDKVTINQVLRQQLKPYTDIPTRNIKCYNHHLSHAVGGFQTSPFERATVVVIDAIGEWDTIHL